MIDFEFERVHAAQDPGASAKKLLFDRLFVQTDLEVFAGRELFKVVADAFAGANGMGRESGNQNGVVMIELYDVVDLTGTNPGYPLCK